MGLNSDQWLMAWSATEDQAWAYLRERESRILELRDIMVSGGELPREDHDLALMCMAMTYMELKYREIELELGDSE